MTNSTQTYTKNPECYPRYCEAADPCPRHARADIVSTEPPVTHTQTADGPIVRTAGGQEIHPEDHDYAAAVTVMGYAKGMARATGSRGAYYMADGVYAQWSRA